MKTTKKKSPENKEITIDMPEVKDIPGQEHVKPPRIKEMRDTTISSASEEGEGILDDLNKEDSDELADNAANVSSLEKKILERADRPLVDDTKEVKKATLDKTDEDSTPLNEGNDPLDMGEDLDIPGSELDNDDEELGEEDEENNAYSGRD